jgi:hypothetical protein
VRRRRIRAAVEDAVFVEPTSLRATGCANFLHVGAETVKFVNDARLRARIRRAPVIVRRGGARKFELDVRTSGLARRRAHCGLPRSSSCPLGVPEMVSSCAVAQD